MLWRYVFWTFQILWTGYHVSVEGDDDVQNIGLNSKAEACPSLVISGGKFEKMSPSSKYLLFSGTVLSGGEDGYSADESLKVCEMGEQLEPAEVTNDIDLQSLQKYIKTSVWLGLNHREGPGLFKEAGGEEIKFQSFVGMQPNNKEGKERCVMLKPYEGGFLEMEDANCDSEVAGVLCQFKKGSSCYLQSAEEATSSTEKTDSDVVALAAGSRFFVSNVQRPWGPALESCLSQGLQLITLDEDDINQELSDQIKKRLAEKHIHPATQFWTGGTFKTDDDEDNDPDSPNTIHSFNKLFWHVGEYNTMPANATVAHQWAQATPDRLEPYDQSSLGLETCLDISFENTELSSTGAHAPFWRSANCFLPKYFICERIPHGIPKETVARLVKEASNDTDGNLSGRLGFRREIQSCGELAVNPVNFAMDITRPQNQADIMKFLIFNMEHNLKNGDVPIDLANPGLKLKATVLELMVKIVEKAVPLSYVDHGMLNVVRTMVLLYHKSLSSDSTIQKIWRTTYTPHLRSCLDATKPLPLGGTGFEIRYLTTKTGDILRDVDINVPEEHADLLENLDMTLEVLWYMFSFIVGHCYTFHEYPLQFAANLHVIFVTDFIHALRSKWVINVKKAGSSDSRGLDYSLAMGDFDFKQSYRNLRHVVTAAYMMNNISDLQLVRPLDMTKIPSDLPSKKENAKTGNTLRFTN